MKLAAALAVSISLVCGVGPALARKVTMPSEGVYELKFCTVGSGSTIVANDKAPEDGVGPRHVSDLATTPAQYDRCSQLRTPLSAAKPDG
jgi:hypothetical protein